MDDRRPITPDQAEVYFEVPERESIVRALAERGPLIPAVVAEHWCVYCRTGPLLSDEEARDTANHESSCLWRRARALYPKESE